jgi:hypothetical protein
MIYARRTAQFLAFLLALCFQPLAVAQQETPFRVGPFGAIPESVRPIKAPRDIASLLPRVAMVRVLQNTKLAPAGETTVVYDIFEPPDNDPDRTSGRMIRNVHVVILRDGKVASDLGAPDEACDLAGFSEFRLDARSNAAAIAFRCGGDGARTNFFLLRFDGQSYTLESLAQTTTGRMEILETDPAEIRVWSAGIDDTCVWCDQHYSTDIYVWQDGAFAPKSHNVTPDAYNPGELNQHPIVKPVPPPKSTS